MSEIPVNGADPAAAPPPPERDDLQDRLLRVTAEFDNYRKRTDRERRELWDTATIDLLRDLLPAIDDLERALAVPADQATAESYRQGVDLIHRQLLEVLRQRGVTAMDAVGHDFDPNLHEAVSHEPAEGRRDGEIVAEFRRGFQLRDRLVRPAMVKVAKA